MPDSLGEYMSLHFTYHKIQTFQQHTMPDSLGEYMSLHFTYHKIQTFQQHTMPDSLGGIYVPTFYIPKNTSLTSI